VVINRRHQFSEFLALAVLIDMAVQASFIFGQHSIYQLDPTARARLNRVYLATFFVGGVVGSQLGSLAYHAGGWIALTLLGGEHQRTGHDLS
jgi:hypothetical protein